MLSTLEHEHIVRFHGTARNKSYLYIVQEFCPDTLRANIFGKTAIQLAPQRKLELSLQICEGMRYLHSQNIMHRDLKPANVLISAAGTVCICDFGLARYKEQINSVREAFHFFCLLILFFCLLTLYSFVQW